MGIKNIFSKKQKRLRGEVPSIYQHSELPETFRNQVIMIIRDVIDTGYELDAYEKISKILRKELGILKFKGTWVKTHRELVFDFFLNTSDVEQALDVIELFFEYIEQICSPQEIVDDALNELNERFKEHGIGYSYEEGQIIKVDSQYIHAEITKPTLNLLWNEKFEGANEEYLEAHEHYKYGRNKACLVACLKAFESTLKIICDEKGWAYDEKKDSATKLIKICYDNDLLPSFTQTQYTSLRSLLDNGITSIRNKTSGHGQGAIPQKVDDEITRYGLNLTGSCIIFLVEQSGIK